MLEITERKQQKSRAVSDPASSQLFLFMGFQILSTAGLPIPPADTINR